ncbi:hypothetical protein QTG56_25045 (plasmid) [Rossellomorea sp. AcN35-11]|nr:hypothetical protein [Rossellomorea aquimaris]WJV31901.1 hypothetical protein QTG56_25045 [Rossellomorea sp. AcN35-11]
MTVKALVKQQMSELLIPIKKGIELTTYQKLEPSTRKNLRLLEGNRDLELQTLEKVLIDTELLEIVNSMPISEQTQGVIETLVNAERELEQIKNTLRESNVCELTPIVQHHFDQVLLDHYNSSSNNLGSTIVDVSLFLKKHNEGKWNVETLTTTVGFDREYNKLEDDNEKTEYLKFKHYTYIKENRINTLQHFRTNKGDFDFYQYVFSQTKENFSTFYQPISNLIKHSDKKEELKQKVQQLFDKHDNKVMNRWFRDLLETEGDTLTEHEINRMLRAEGTEENVLAFIYGESSPTYNILNELRKSYTRQSVHKNLIKRAFKEKKKAFLRLISQPEMIKEFKGMGTSNILFTGLYERVNVNTLNQKNLDAIMKMHNKRNLKKIPTHTIITFNELEALYGAHELNIDIFYRLMDLSVEKRLKAFRELPSLETLSGVFETEEDMIGRVVELLKQKPFKSILKDKKYRFPGATDEQLLALLVAPERFTRFMSEIKTGADIKFIMNNQKILELADDLESLKSIFVKRDKQMQFMINKMELSKEFIDNNLSRIISFYDRDLVNVFNSIHEHDKQSKEQLKNLALLTKAELSGKLKDIKFADEDFELEIGLPISDTTKSEWKVNRSNKQGNFKVEETYDYEATIRIGELPVRSCLHWKNGSYSRCLLSNFDTNKKLLIARDSKGNIVSRALLRLTKYTDNPLAKTKEKRLGFKDIENEDQSNSIAKGEPNEKLVLFLEKSYSSLDATKEDNQASKVESMFFELAKEKAEALGAELMTASHYNNERLQKTNTHIFVSYSKNGYQYLDSMSGQSSESNEGNYKAAEVLKLKSAI